MLRTIPHDDLCDACAAFAIDPMTARVAGRAIVHHYRTMALLIQSAALYEQLSFYYAVLLHLHEPARHDPESIRALAAQTNRTLRTRLFGPIHVGTGQWN